MGKKINFNEPHQTTPMVIPGSNGFTVDIDLAIIPLIRRLWSIGIVTKFCCEGYDVDKSTKDRSFNSKAAGRRAYVMMVSNSEALRFVTDSLEAAMNNIVKRGPLWEIQYDNYAEKDRVTFRFPKEDIPFLCDVADRIHDEQRSVITVHRADKIDSLDEIVNAS